MTQIINLKSYNIVLDSEGIEHQDMNRTVAETREWLKKEEK